MKTQMTEDEKDSILMEVIRLRNEGKEAEASKLIKTYPLEPEFAKNVKEVYGAEFLVQYGYNLSEAEAKYGKDWLNK